MMECRQLIANMGLILLRNIFKRVSDAAEIKIERMAWRQSESSNKGNDAVFRFV